MSSKKHVLIVDDQKELYDILSKFLNNKDYIISYKRAEDSIEFISKEEKIDLIIMDIMMPNINGFDLTKEIRNLDLEIYIPIIMLTAKSDLSDVVKGLEYGADDYVTKPFEFSELLARIESNIRRSNQESSKSQFGDIVDIQEIKRTLNEKNKELEKKVFYLNNLVEMSYELHSVLELKKLVNIALFALISHLGSKSAALLMSTSPLDAKIIPLDSKGIPESLMRDLAVDRFDELFKYFNETDLPVLVSELNERKELKETLKPFVAAGIELIAPIQHGEHLDGFVLLGGRFKQKEYNPEEINVIKMFNSMLAVAISNASMYEKIKELSYTDGMTSLHNYRYFEKRLSEELARAKRNKSPLSLIIMDVDYFKNFNDTLGHQAGDDALRILGRVMKETARNVDIVCRYGGEEFAAILPNIDEAGALIFGERLCTAVYEEKFPKEEVQPNGRITCSVGVSVFPIDADDINDLIYKADLALYKAKNDGRNRVVMYKDTTSNAV